MNVLNVSREAILPHPVARVGEALLAELPRIAAVLPNVAAIEPLSLEPKGNVVDRRDRWTGRASSSVLRALLPADVVTWTIRSSWQLEPYRVSWVLEPVDGIVAVEGAGSVHLDHVAAGTRVAIETRLFFRGGLGVLAAVGSARVERVVGDLFRANVDALFAGAAALISPLGRAS